MGLCREPDPECFPGSHGLDQLLMASQGDMGLCHTSGAQWSAAGPAVLHVCPWPWMCPGGGHKSRAHGLTLQTQVFLPWAEQALQLLLAVLSVSFGLSAGDHLQAPGTSPGSIVSSTLHLLPRKVPISVSCPGLLLAGLRGGLELGPFSCLLFVASDSLSLPIDVQGFPKKNPKQT